MKSTLARWLLDDLRDCPSLHPYRDLDPSTTLPRADAAMMELLRMDAVAWLWDAT